MSKPQSLYSRWVARFATATLATVATHEGKKGLSVATVATVAVANPNSDKAANDPTVASVATVTVANPNSDKAATPEQNPSFVGFVAYPPPHFGKNEDEPKPTDNPTPYPVDWHQAHAAYQRHHITCPACIAAGLGYGQRCDEGQRLWDAYEAAPMPELGQVKRWPIPTTAPPAPSAAPYRMTPRSDSEIMRMVELYRRALAVGLPDDAALDKLLDAVMDAPSDMGSCFACSHLRGSEPDRWRCAGHGHELSGSPLARAFVVQLHRCDGYGPPVA